MKRLAIVGIWVILATVSMVSLASAQGAQVPFGGLALGPDTRVEISADALSIDQESGKAVFSGNVIAGIEDMRLRADNIEVAYSDETTGGTGPISRLIATGSVIFTNGDEAAEGDFADFDLEANEIMMTGNVILTQGKNALSGQKLRINLDTGTALIEGRVQTIFQTGASE